LGYDTKTFAMYSVRGRKLSSMSKDKPQDANTVYGAIRKMVKDGKPPLAVLLGGGGNDFVDGKTPAVRSFCDTTVGVGSALESVLVKSMPEGYDKVGLANFVAKMQTHLNACIERLAEACTDASGNQVATIVVHAYDHPIPDGRALDTIWCPWMNPVFDRKGYTLVESTKLMKTFIDALNCGYECVVNNQKKNEVLVNFVRLTGQLESAWSAKGGTYESMWGNEMHPSKEGFAVLAKHIHNEVLETLIRSRDSLPKHAPARGGLSTRS